MSTPKTDYLTMVEHTEELLFQLRQKITALNSLFITSDQRKKIISDVETLKRNIYIKAHFVVDMKGYN